MSAERGVRGDDDEEEGEGDGAVGDRGGGDAYKGGREEDNEEAGESEREVEAAWAGGDELQVKRRVKEVWKR